MILKGRLFWKILLGFWLAIVLVSQLLWLGFRAERAPPEEHLAQQLASQHLEMAARYEENALLEAVLKSIGNKKVTLYEMQGFDHGQVLGPACYLIADYVKRFK